MRIYEFMHANHLVLTFQSGLCNHSTELTEVFASILPQRLFGLWHFCCTIEHEAKIIKVKMERFIIV